MVLRVCEQQKAQQEGEVQVLLPRPTSVIALQFNVVRTASLKITGKSKRGRSM